MLSLTFRNELFGQTTINTKPPLEACREDARKANRHVPSMTTEHVIRRWPVILQSTLLARDNDSSAVRKIPEDFLKTQAGR